MLHSFSKVQNCRKHFASQKKTKKTKKQQKTKNQNSTYASLLKRICNFLQFCTSLHSFQSYCLYLFTLQRQTNQYLICIQIPLYLNWRMQMKSWCGITVWQCTFLLFHSRICVKKKKNLNCILLLLYCKVLISFVLK